MAETPNPNPNNPVLSTLARSICGEFMQAEQFYPQAQYLDDLVGNLKKQYPTADAVGFRKQRAKTIGNALLMAEGAATEYRDGEMTAEVASATFKQVLPILCMMLFHMHLQGSNVPDAVGTSYDEYLKDRNDLNKMRAFLNAWKRAGAPNAKPYVDAISTALEFVEEVEKSKPKQWQADAGLKKNAILRGGPKTDMFRQSVLDLYDYLVNHHDRMMAFLNKLNAAERQEMEPHLTHALGDMKKRCSWWLKLSGEDSEKGRRVLERDLGKDVHALGRVLAMAANKHDLPEPLRATVESCINLPENPFSLMGMVHMQSITPADKLGMDWQPMLGAIKLVENVNKARQVGDWGGERFR